MLLFKTALAGLLLSAVITSNALGQTIASSPDKKLIVSVHVNNGVPAYSVTYAGKPFLETSPLGLISSAGDFAVGLKMISSSVRRITDNYALNRSKVSRVTYMASELTCTLLNAHSDTVYFIFRISNRDVALSYRIPQNGRTDTTCTIEKELTGFNLPAGTTTFITPQAPALTGWKKSKPSYEEEYTHDEPVATKSQYGLGYTFPALFHLGKTGWMLISETGISGDYPGTRLSEADPQGIYRIAFPEEQENNGIGPVTASGKYPMHTSWKTITVGTGLGPIVESTVSTDVVKPVMPASRVFKPGRASWSWIVWQDASCNYEDQVTYIDLAAALKCEYILIDAFWDEKIGRVKMEELAKYAAKKNVGILLWYNSNGNWNEAPQTPKNLMNDAAARKEEMAWMERTGIKGIKVDFFGGDKQETMKLYHDILVDAAAHGLTVNFHGATLPRGWDRMYPNFVTAEAVLTSENIVFRQAFADQYPVTATVYPFTRNAVASMDFGPVFLNSRLSRTEKNGTIRRTTDAFEIATAVLFFSAVQHWALTPQNLVQKPGYLIDFIRDVPTVWDETRLIDGYPGKYCVLARRKGAHWYVCAVNGQKEKLTLVLNLPMLAGKTVKLIGDGEGQSSVLSELTVQKGKSVVLKLAPNGGAVMY